MQTFVRDWLTEKNHLKHLLVCTTLRITAIFPADIDTCVSPIVGLLLQDLWDYNCPHDKNMISQGQRVQQVTLIKQDFSLFRGVSHSGTSTTCGKKLNVHFQTRKGLEMYHLKGTTGGRANKTIPLMLGRKNSLSEFWEFIKCSPFLFSLTKNSRCLGFWMCVLNTMTLGNAQIGLKIPSCQIHLTTSLLQSFPPSLCPIIMIFCKPACIYQNRSALKQRKTPHRPEWQSPDFLTVLWMELHH